MWAKPQIQCCPKYASCLACRQWGKLTREVRPECASVSAVATQLVKHYRKLLLAFEAHAVETAGTPVCGVVDCCILCGAARCCMP